ncbi:MAG: exo-alpha-sialidase [Pirellulales bacterium]|nr:exo-alpha-sialidase [Pirellulales bacterium]
MPEQPGFWTEEFDVAELPGGGLLAVYRTNDVQNHPRQQNVIAKKGDTWEPGPVTDAPFPYSGHPEVLATKEGLVMHIATSGTSWTADTGKTWATLEGVPGSAYYPRSVQLDDGTIMVVGHVGGDDPYGVPDQSIVMDTYTITVTKNGDQR